MRVEGSEGVQQHLASPRHARQAAAAARAIAQTASASAAGNALAQEKLQRPQQPPGGRRGAVVGDYCEQARLPTSAPPWRGRLPSFNRRCLTRGVSP